MSSSFAVFFDFSMFSLPRWKCCRQTTKSCFVRQRLLFFLVHVSFIFDLFTFVLKKLSEVFWVVVRFLHLFFCSKGCLKTQQWSHDSWRNFCCLIFFLEFYLYFLFFFLLKRFSRDNKSCPQVLFCCLKCFFLDLPFCSGKLSVDNFCCRMWLPGFMSRDNESCLEITFVVWFFFMFIFPF